jgi:hypothetical protein
MPEAVLKPARSGADRRAIRIGRRPALRLAGRTALACRQALVQAPVLA